MNIVYFYIKSETFFTVVFETSFSGELLINISTTDFLKFTNKYNKRKSF